jgi:hypothetical protein
MWTLIDNGRKEISEMQIVIKSLLDLVATLPFALFLLKQSLKCSRSIKI